MGTGRGALCKREGTRQVFSHELGPFSVKGQRKRRKKSWYHTIVHQKMQKPYRSATIFTVLLKNSL